jgi:hypothetical protein
MKENYLEPHGGMDSSCPKCNQWEHQGNIISNYPQEDGSDDRVCGNCNHKWKTIFTPAGFLPVGDKEIA